MKPLYKQVQYISIQYTDCGLLSAELFDFACDEGPIQRLGQGSEVRCKGSDTIGGITIVNIHTVC